MKISAITIIKRRVTDEGIFDEYVVTVLRDGEVGDITKYFYSMNEVLNYIEEFRGAN